MTASGLRRLPLVATACSLVLLTPFASFLGDHLDLLLQPEGLLAVAALVAAGLAAAVVAALLGPVAEAVVLSGLVTLFLDFQVHWLDSTTRVAMAFAVVLAAGLLLRRHLALIVATVFGVMLASTLLLAPDAPPETTERAVPPPRADLPILVHLILDEHIGIEAIPTDIGGGPELKRRLQELYIGRGFSLFGEAYSHYPVTIDSIPNALNFSALDIADALVEPEPGTGPRLARSAYLDRVRELGYRIHVFQNFFLDFCGWDRDAVASCVNYNVDPNSLAAIRQLDLPARAKARLILTSFARLAFVRGKAQFLYLKVLQGLDPERTRVPRLWPRDSMQWGIGLTGGPLPAPHVIEEMARLVPRASPGDMFLVYLQMPHFPYVFDADCTLRDPLGGWTNKEDPPPLPLNTGATREHRYRLYFAQAECLASLLQRTFDAWRAAGIWERLAIVVHGDHSSRIYARYPAERLAGAMTRQDLLDTFPTLFAVKPPGGDARYVLGPRPIDRLLLASAVGKSPGLPEDSPEERFVFLHSTDRRGYVRLPFEGFMQPR